MRVEIEGGLLGHVAIEGEAREQVNEEIERAVVTGALDLAYVLELINDGLDKGTLAQKKPVRERDELIAHVLAQFGDEPQSLVDQEAPEEAACQSWHRPSVVGIAGSEAKRKQLAAIADNQVEFDALEPAD